jgi:uncharacterized protein
MTEKSVIFPWGHTKRYNDYATWLRSQFHGQRIQKLSINAGFTCPNRDGSKSIHGCSYCNNTAFRPDYCVPSSSVTQQIDEGAEFFSHKYPNMRFLAYFQSYSNTYGDLTLLKSIYQEALAHEKIDGLVIGTRPDCVDDEILDMIGEIAKKVFVSIEYGLESTVDRTLDRINRQHTFQEAVDAIVNTKARNIHTGAHLILGLPGESEEELLSHATKLSALPIDSLKLHQLQIVKKTTFAVEYTRNPSDFHLFTLPEYIDLVIRFLELLNPAIAVDRFINQSPKEMLIAPNWGLKNFEVMQMVEKVLAERDTWQGRVYAPIITPC